MNLKTDTVLITGGAAGIGLEMTKQLVALGNTVIITGRDMAKLEAVTKDLPSVAIYQSDVSDPKAIRILYERIREDFPSLNVLINNAGIMRSIDFNNTEYDKICDEVDINLSGPIRMVQCFLPLLKKQAEAAIVNVSSGLAFINFPQAPIYSASKIALHSYTKSLRLHLKDTNVKVFELAPPKTSKPLFNRDDAGVGQGGSAAPRGGGIPTMEVPDVVKIAIDGIRQNKFEIKPGMTKVLKLAGRFSL